MNEVQTIYHKPDVSTSTVSIDFRDYQLKKSHRVRENIEWSETYSFNSKDINNPRVLLIGDSICNGYQEMLRQNLRDRANITFWISSKCVTDFSYLRELDSLLDYQPYSMIVFNNGLHSLWTDKSEWQMAYDGVIRFMMAKCPKTKITIVSTTPLKNPDLTEISKKLSGISKEIAETYKIPFFDFFTFLDKLDREAYWSDVYHLNDEGRQMLADKMTAHIEKTVHLPGKGKIIQQGTETGPDGSLK